MVREGIQEQMGENSSLGDTHGSPSLWLLRIDRSIQMSDIFANVLLFFFFFANVLSFCQRTVSGEESQILLLISVFNLLQYVVSFEENLTSHQHVAGNQRSILIAFPDKRGLSLMLIPPPKKKSNRESFHNS